MASAGTTPALLIQRVKLTVIEGPDAGRALTLEQDPVSVGSLPDNSLPLTDRTVSRRHALIVLTDAGDVRVLGYALSLPVNRVVSGMVTEWAPTNVRQLPGVLVLSRFAGAADELDGAIIHRVVAYRTAAKVIADAPVSVAALAREGRATELAGIGNTLQEKIVTLVETGEIPRLSELRAPLVVACAAAAVPGAASGVALPGAPGNSGAPGSPVVFCARDGAGRTSRLGRIAIASAARMRPNSGPPPRSETRLRRRTALS